MWKLNFKTIPHDTQRYETVGDYYETTNGYGDKKWDFRVSDMGNDDYEFLVFIHELVEWRLTQKRGISEESITAFDKEFEAKRKQGNIDEPGHDLNAPYHKEHVFAELIERMVAHELGIDWEKYDEVVNNL